MNFQEQQEQDILSQIKKLSSQISQAQSLTGLMMYQSEIQRFYENFILAKKLNESKEWKNFAKQQTESSQSVDTLKFKEESNVELPIETNEPVIEKQISQEQIQEEMPIKPTILEGKIDYNFSIQSGKKYKPLTIDLNDRIAFMKYLFNGDKEEYEHFVENLNMRNQVTSETYINHYIEQMGWTKKQEEYIQRLSELNEKRFE